MRIYSATAAVIARIPILTLYEANNNLCTGRCVYSRPRLMNKC
jgi:hypothetical protein